MANPQDYQCPRCGQVDMVQKVSALVEGGTAAGVYSNTAGIKVSGITLSAKASQLAPPQEPIYKYPRGCVTNIVILLGIILAVFAVLGIFFNFSSPEIRGSDKWLGAIGYGVVAVLGMVLAIWLGKKLRKVRAERQNQYVNAKSQWTHAMKMWNELYYCARNDVVFLPGNPGSCVPASEMLSLLYRP